MRHATIDHHVHLYPSEVGADPGGWAEARGERHWAELCARTRKSGRPVQGFPSLDHLLQAMDGAGIRQAVLLGWYWEDPSTCEWHNRFMADCHRLSPDRIRFFGTVHPAMGAEGLKREVAALRELGCEGLGELSPHTQGGPGNPFWDLVFAEAATLSWPVNLHVTHPGGRPYPGRVETPLEDFLGWARRHPRTQFILAHFGGGLAVDDRALALPNVRFDTAAAPLASPAGEPAETLAKAGCGRILFGSDYPLDLYPAGGYKDFGLARWVTEFRALAGG